MVLFQLFQQSRPLVEEEVERGQVQIMQVQEDQEVVQETLIQKAQEINHQ
jgi:hypothetical protein